MRNMEFKPIVGMVGIGNRLDREQNMDYQTVINRVRNLDLEFIDGGIEAEGKEIKFLIEEPRRKDLDVLLIVVLQGMSAELIKEIVEIMDCPCILWAVKGRWAWPSSVLALGCLQEKKRVKLLYPIGDGGDVLAELGKTLRAAFALSRLRKSRIGQIGSLFPNLIACDYDEGVIESKLGIKLVKIGFDRLRDGVDSISRNTSLLQELKEKIMSEFIVKTTEDVLMSGIRLHLALKTIAEEDDLHGFATECWSAMPKEMGLNPCLGFIEDDYVLGCEGDVLICVATLMVKYLTAINPYVGDLYDLDEDNILTLVHCGGPASLCAKNKRTFIKESAQAKEQGFSTGVCLPWLNKGPATVFRLYGKGCDWVHAVSGQLTQVVRQKKMWVRVRLSGEPKKFLKNCLANHYVVVPRNVLDELRILCEWLGIRIVES